MSGAEYTAASEQQASWEPTTWTHNHSALLLGPCSLFLVTRDPTSALICGQRGRPLPTFTTSKGGREGGRERGRPCLRQCGGGVRPLANISDWGAPKKKRRWRRKKRNCASQGSVFKDRFNCGKDFALCKRDHFNSPQRPAALYFIYTPTV